MKANQLILSDKGVPFSNTFIYLYIFLPYRNKSFSCSENGSKSCPHLCHIGALDREMSDTGVITVTLLARDRGTPPRSAVTTVTVNITGINDHPPYFDQLNKNVTLLEGRAVKNFYTAVVSTYFKSATQ